MARKTVIARGKHYDDEARMISYRAAFSTPAGREVFHDLIAEHFMLSSTAHADPHIMAIQEGERRVVLRIFKLLQMTPADLPQVQRSVLEQFGFHEAADSMAGI